MGLCMFNYMFYHIFGGSPACKTLPTDYNKLGQVIQWPAHTIGEGQVALDHHWQKVLDVRNEAVCHSDLC